MHTTIDHGNNMLPIDLRPDYPTMKRYYDTSIEFSLYTAPHHDEYAMSFDLSWGFADMVEYMCDLYSIERDSIIEMRQTFVKRFKLSKND